jgi:hypothetical protein
MAVSPTMNGWRWDRDNSRLDVYYRGSRIGAFASAGFTFNGAKTLANSSGNFTLTGSNALVLNGGSGNITIASSSVSVDASGTGTITLAGTSTGNVVIGSALAFGSDSSAAKSIVAGSTNGLKIGTATTQKIGFFNKTPVVQLAKASYSNWGALSNVVQALVDIGLFDAA